MKNAITGESVIPVPTLSSKGFVYTTGDCLDNLLAFYFLCNHNQSEIFKGRVVSYQHTLANHQDQPTVLCQMVQQELTTYLSRYFNLVSVEVNWKDEIEGSGNGDYQVEIDVMAGNTLDDQQRLYKTTNIKQGKLYKIFTYNNSGVMIRNDYDAETNTRLR